MSEKITFEIDKDDAVEVAHLIRWALNTQPTTGALPPKLYAIASKLDPVEFSTYDYILYSRLYDKGEEPHTKEQREEIIDTFRKIMEG